jgi:hypothetical protein
MKNITRQTIRADGLTVGEAMDQDAAFLRSIGIPAKDGTKPINERKDDFTQKVRELILDALDDAAKTEGDSRGWEDADLPAIFKVIDQHSTKLFDKIHL